MRPSDALRDRLEAVRAIIARSPFGNPRVFGSVARGEDDEASDLDLLVDGTDGASLFDLARLQIDLEALLGVRVDVLTADSIGPRIAGDVFRDLRPL
ncbi:nucleotidyltransferase family protein [Paracraurococcus lichenis]|uniref:Nucleotidyltransferase family protein n=1 Tax=Paracraurococcus lichenis TaxID=3064888 RepID=A0ABT9E7D5_9PROT|nr:nucleotidyltransferase family protein [Paracraurococcus sp. LOR1-02]MDO9712090.1 nucleotidyltransferase family protein [Paracraurococcus sp. LOR1-02]